MSRSNQTDVFPSLQEGHFGAAYLGSGTLSRQDLEFLWQQGGWAQRCVKPDCDGTVYFHVVVGSPLSGSGQVHGKCTGCDDPSKSPADYSGGMIAELVKAAKAVVDEQRR